MADQFAGAAPTLSAPASHAALVTPNDSADLATMARSLYVGGTGDIKVTTVGGETLLFSAVPVGVLPVRIARVWSTTTTATNIIALW